MHESWTVTRHPSRRSLPPAVLLQDTDDPVLTVLAMDVPWFLDGTCADGTCADALKHLIASDLRAVPVMYAQSMIQDVTDWVAALREVLPGAPDDSLIGIAVDWDNWNFSPTYEVLSMIAEGVQPHVGYLRLTMRAEEHTFA